MATRSHEVLPVRIQMTLEERRAYHRRFFYIFTFCLIFQLAVSIMTGIEVNKEPDLWLIILLLWCPLLVLCVYLIRHQRKQVMMLDNGLHKNAFTVVRGTLESIAHLRYKRVRYVLSGKPIEGVLAFPGFTAFQNTRVINVVATYGRETELYLLPGGIIAGAIYPEFDNELTHRSAILEDWQSISATFWGRIKLFAYTALFVSLLIIGTCWFIDYKLGHGWESLGMLLSIFNGIVLLLIVIDLLIKWPEFCALMNKNHSSIQVQTCRGIASEWYLTATRYGGGPTTTTWSGYIRLCGTLHRIREDFSAVDRDFMNSLWTPILVEYLTYKGRPIFIRSVTPKNYDT